MEKQNVQFHRVDKHDCKSLFANFIAIWAQERSTITVCSLCTLPVIRMTGRDNEAVQAALLAAKYRASRAAKLPSPVHPAREVEKPGSRSLSKLSGIGAGLWIYVIPQLMCLNFNLWGVTSKKGTHHF